MRNILMVSVTALALTACGPKADNSSANNMAASDTMTVDNTTVAANDSMDSNGAMTASASTPDFVTNAAMGDMFEIASSKLATTQATASGVKKFATDMIAAHTATTAGLKAAIAKDGVKVTPPATLDAEHQAMIDALKAAKGEAFDTLYKSQQTDAHTKALALMESYATTGDQPALKSFASETAPKVKMHLDTLNKM